MITEMKIRGFKRFENVEIPLGNPVVFIGPNNSGKSTALQALALWSTGLKRWSEKRAGKQTPKIRSGVTINRRDLVAVPVPTAKLLWRNLHVRESEFANDKQTTTPVLIEIIVDGVDQGEQWSCGLEFDYANEESFYCRPLRKTPDRKQVMEIPTAALQKEVAFLPPMSGLVANETRLDPGAINVRIGEGRTAEVLRNLCHGLSSRESGEPWKQVCDRVRRLFGVDLAEPKYIQERGEIVMDFREQSGVSLDLSCSGRGLQQVVLLLAYIHTNPGSVLLLDEPDAHLEILRQRQVYQVLTEEATDNDCQVVVASHSEVLLNEAADRDVVVAFVGKPHRIDDRGSQVAKSLKQIGFEHYYQAEQAGWVLYVEGSTDLAILRSLANRLDHPAAEALERPYVHYVENKVQAARDHYYGLREAKTDLVGLALLDRLESITDSDEQLQIYQWTRREIENYLCQPETLEAYAEKEIASFAGGPLFADKCVRVMQTCIQDIVPPVALRDRSDRWWTDVKASDEFLDRVVSEVFKKLKLPNLMRKTDYHVLAKYIPVELIPQEVSEVLDLIHETHRRATPG